MLKNEGPSSFFKGLSFPVYSVPLITWISYSGRPQMLDQFSINSTFYKNLANGAYLALLTSFFSTPAELVKTLVQCNNFRPLHTLSLTPNQSEITLKASFNTSFACFKSLLTNEGLNGVFKGARITAFRDISAFTAQFSTFEICKEWMARGFGEELCNFHVYAAGVAAGISGWLFSYPQDVIKTHIQAGRYKKISETCMWIMKEHGLSGFWRGFSSVLPRTLFSNGLGFVAYETLLHSMQIND